MKAHRLLENPASNGIVIDVCGVEAEVGQRLVDGFSGFEEAIKRLPRVVGLKQWATRATRGPLKKNIRLRIEPDDDAHLLQRLTVLLSQYSAPTCGENNTGDTDQISQHSLLYIAEPILSHLRKNLRNAFILSLHDQVIGIHKAVTGERGETPTNGGLATPHESRKYKIR